MKAKTILYAMLFSLFALPLTAHAQSDMQSGSVRITASGADVLQAELIGPQAFRETFSETIVFANLIPGEYSITITSSQRGWKNITLRQMISVGSGQRTLIQVSKSRLLIQSTIDRNSQTICFNTYSRYRPVAMSDRDFDLFISNVKQARYDDDKFNLISAACLRAQFYTDQVKQIMRLFTYDEKRLQCAKIMMEHVVDEQNLYSLSSEFTYSSNKNQYLEYLKQLPENNNNNRELPPPPSSYRAKPI